MATSQYGSPLPDMLNSAHLSITHLTLNQKPHLLLHAADGELSQARIGLNRKPSHVQ
jgi:hypothetical protein